MKIIEVLIAIILMYAILSILVSMLVEFWNDQAKLRSRMLKETIIQMLKESSNQSYGPSLLKHPLVSSMRNEKEKNRSFQYLDGGIFADALIDVIGSQANHVLPEGSNPNNQQPIPSTMHLFENGLRSMNSSPFRDAMMSLLSKSDGSYKELKESIEKWYNSNMDRLSGWYKRKQRWRLVFVGLVVSFMLNIDSIHLFRVLSIDDTLRANLVEVAEKVVDKYQNQDINNRQLTSIVDSTLAIIAELDSINGVGARRNDSLRIDTLRYSKFRNRIDELALKIIDIDSTSKQFVSNANRIVDISSQVGIPIGWNKDEAPLSWRCSKSKPPMVIESQNRLEQYLYRRNHDYGTHWFSNSLLWLFGVIFSGIMLCFGAPFWFDMLVKFVNIRSSGKKPTANSQE